MFFAGGSDGCWGNWGGWRHCKRREEVPSCIVHDASCVHCGSPAQAGLFAQHCQRRVQRSSVTTEASELCGTLQHARREREWLRDGSRVALVLQGRGGGAARRYG